MDANMSFCRTFTDTACAHRSSAHPELAYLVSKRLGIPLSDAGIYRKPSGEIGLDLKESVREADVYILK